MSFRYWPFYCEENVWHLCADDRLPAPPEERRVIVIAGARSRFVMRGQRAGEGGPVLWDYHVVLAAQGKVWDLDTTLGFPVDLEVWVRDSFLPVYQGFEPRFRVVVAATFRERFASDRSHMRGPDGAWLKPPPPWPAIGEGSTLRRFIDMSSPFVGEITDLASLKA
ncbi:MAG TPA: hypothetical protein VE981_13065 [Planctomycetota bacterium]|nr:hypothetical protein [Planctomycetota bacterium]